MAISISEWIKRYIEVQKIRRSNKGDDLWEVVTDSDSVTVYKNRRVYQTMRWTDVKKLCMTQRDLFSYEQVNVLLCDSKDRFIWIEELMVGFQPFCKVADGHFPGFADVVETFCRNAWGRWNAVPRLWLDLQPGGHHVVPQSWIDSVPPQSRGAIF